MEKVTWNEGPEAPKIENGLPYEIHFWKNGRDVRIAADYDRGFLTWDLWEVGTPIKNVGQNVA